MLDSGFLLVLIKDKTPLIKSASVRSQYFPASLAEHRSDQESWGAEEHVPVLCCGVTEQLVPGAITAIMTIIAISSVTLLLNMCLISPCHDH